MRPTPQLRAALDLADFACGLATKVVSMSVEFGYRFAGDPRAAKAETYFRNTGRELLDLAIQVRKAAEESVEAPLPLFDRPAPAPTPAKAEAPPVVPELPRPAVAPRTIPPTELDQAPGVKAPVDEPLPDDDQAEPESAGPAMNWYAVSRDLGATRRRSGARTFTVVARVEAVDFVAAQTYCRERYPSLGFSVMPGKTSHAGHLPTVDAYAIKVATADVEVKAEAPALPLDDPPQGSDGSSYVIFVGKVAALRVYDNDPKRAQDRFQAFKVALASENVEAGDLTMMAVANAKDFTRCPMLSDLHLWAGGKPHWAPAGLDVARQLIARGRALAVEVASESARDELKVVRKPRGKGKGKPSDGPPAIEATPTSA